MTEGQQTRGGTHVEEADGVRRRSNPAGDYPHPPGRIRVRHRPADKLEVRILRRNIAIQAK